MPTTVLYKDADGSAPLLTWLDGLPEKARLACIAAVPPIEIQRAKDAKAAFEADPLRHTHKE
jgi:hypothetical protein